MHSQVDERTSLPFFLSSLTGALDARQTHTECNLCVHAAHHRVPPSVTGAMFTIAGCVLSPIEPFKSGRVCASYFTLSRTDKFRAHSFLTRLWKKRPRKVWYLRYGYDTLSLMYPQ
jgi:hypothetical protein